MVKPIFTLGTSEDAKKIRTHVFVEEQGFKNEFDEWDDNCWSLVLYLDDYPIGTGRLKEIDPETYQLQRIAVEAPFRGKKVGTYLIKFLCNKAISLGARKAKVLAQVSKMGFYSRLGFRVCDDGEIEMDEGVPHIWMEKVIVRPRKKPARF